MDLWTIIKVVFRRWYAVFPILVLTAVAGYQIAYKAPPTYEAAGSALLVAPNIVTGATGTVFKQNPYLLFSGSLNITAAVVVRILNDPIERDALFKAGLLADYEVGADQSSPAIGVRAEGDTAKVVVDTVGRLLDDVEKNLRELQDTADAPQDLRIGVEILVRPSQALTKEGKVARTMATIGVLGALLAVGVALLWEAAASSRKRSKAAAAAARLAAELSVPAMTEPEQEPDVGAGPPPAAKPRRRAAAGAAKSEPLAEPAEPAETELLAAEVPARRRGRRKAAAAKGDPSAEEAEVDAVTDDPDDASGGPAADGADEPAPDAAAGPATDEVPAPRRKSRKRSAPSLADPVADLSEPAEPAPPAEDELAPPAVEPEPPRRRRGRRAVPVEPASANGSNPHPVGTEAGVVQEAETGSPAPVD